MFYKQRGIRMFNFTDYKNLMREKIKENQHVRGYQTSLAKGAGCQRSFISQCINSHIHITPDHAAGLGKFWGFDEDESEYFLELVNYARSGSKQLKSIIKRKLGRLKKKQEDLSQRYKKPRVTIGENEARYYSTWFWRPFMS